VDASDKSAEVVEAKSLIKASISTAREGKPSTAGHNYKNRTSSTITPRRLHVLPASTDPRRFRAF
jgi:hypothetical protein